MTVEERKRLIGATVIDIEESDKGVVAVYVVKEEEGHPTSYAINITVSTKTAAEICNLDEVV